jgi:hypothetical protein
MAEKLMKYYAYVGQEAGMGAKIKLATATKIPSTKAAMEPDSPENISAFRTAIEEITGKPAPHF